VFFTCGVLARFPSLRTRLNDTSEGFPILAVLKPRRSVVFGDWRTATSLFAYSASIPPYQRAQPQSCRTKGGNSRRNMANDVFVAYSIAVILDICNPKGNAVGLSSVVGMWFFPPNPLPTSTLALASPPLNK